MTRHETMIRAASLRVVKREVGECRRARAGISTFDAGNRVDLCRFDVGEGAAQLGDRVVPQRPEQIGEVGEVAVEQAGRHARSGRDGAHRRRRQATLGVDLGRCPRNSPTLLVAFLVGRCGSGHVGDGRSGVNVFRELSECRWACRDGGPDVPSGAPHRSVAAVA